MSPRRSSIMIFSAQFAECRAQLEESRYRTAHRALPASHSFSSELRDDVELALRHRLNRQSRPFANDHHVLESRRRLQLLERHDARKLLHELDVDHDPRRFLLRISLADDFRISGAAR